MVGEMASFPQVDRRHDLSVREFKREYQEPGRPVVITDATHKWRACSTWTFEYLRSRYGSTPMEVHRYEDGKYQPDRMEVMPLDDYIGRILAGDANADTCPLYIRDDWKIFVNHTELLADYAVPAYFFDWFRLLPPFLRLIYPRIFIGPQGAVTPLHHDIWETHAWLAQIVGRKRWILFSPDQRQFLYDYRVKPERPDLQAFPLFRKARPVECTIGPGDIVFVPSRWAHWVVSLDPTVSLTHNYMGPGCLWPGLRNSLRERVGQRMGGVLGGLGTRTAKGRLGLSQQGRSVDR